MKTGWQQPVSRSGSPSSRRAWIEIESTRFLSTSKMVALLAEGVDRNVPTEYIHNIREYVALLAEGVDRNIAPGKYSTAGSRSPSSRRAWIEITTKWGPRLRSIASPSSRRAWIEIGLRN